MKKFQFPKVKFGKKFFLSKKFLIGVVITAVIVVGAVVGINSMKGGSALAKAMGNLAEARHYMKHAENTALRVQFFSGMREEPYNLDGKAEKLTPFAIINVDPKDNSLKDYNQIDGTVLLGEEQVPVTLSRNPYDRNFAADLSRLVDAATSVSVTLFITSTEHPTFALANAMGEGAISWEAAVEKAVECVGDKIKTPNFEVYVKIVNDMADNSGAFWYVQFVTADGKTFFCVIAPDGAHIS